MRQICEAAFEALGTEARISAVPMWMLRAMAALVRPFNVNVASLMMMFTAFSDEAVTDRYGDRTVAEFFRERVAAGEMAVRSP